MAQDTQKPGQDTSVHEKEQGILFRRQTCLYSDPDQAGVWFESFSMSVIFLEPLLSVLWSRGSIPVL